MFSRLATFEVFESRNQRNLVWMLLILGLVDRHDIFGNHRLSEAAARSFMSSVMRHGLAHRSWLRSCVSNNVAVESPQLGGLKFAFDVAVNAPPEQDSTYTAANTNIHLGISSKPAHGRCPEL